MLSYDDSSSWLIIIFVLWFLIYRNIGCCDFLFFSHSMEYNAKMKSQSLKLDLFI